MEKSFDVPDRAGGWVKKKSFYGVTTANLMPPLHGAWGFVPVKNMLLAVSEAVVRGNFRMRTVPLETRSSKSELPVVRRSPT
jgi:hypothetical protein